MLYNEFKQEFTELKDRTLVEKSALILKGFIFQFRTNGVLINYLIKF